MRKISMADPHFDAADRERIHREIDLILSGPLSMGPNVQAFEREFAAMVGVRYAVAMNSCTAALEIALRSQGAAGGEVILPAETFVATGMAVHLTGATPVFAEISASTFCLDLEDVKRRVTARTKAIVLVHMAGFITPDVVEFRQYCDARGLCLIEDAAHAPGAVRAGRAAGSFGHVGCFSFYPTKVITAGEGGMLTTDDEDLAAYARSLQHRGRDMQASGEQYRLPGRNVRMTEIAALLGRVQLGHLGEFLGQRQRLAAVYKCALQRDTRVDVILPDDPKASSCWKIPVLLNRGIDRTRVTQRMGAAGVSVDWAYDPPLHLQPVFRELYGTAEGHLPRTEDLMARHICLPCHPRMSADDAAHVAQSLKDALDAHGA
jgi:perosamine synthetase